jgi:alpha-glucosidase (family GH31 glycosyl hydrolase)
MTDPEARDWFAGQYEGFMGEGMDGMWTDLGEPELHPDDMRHHGGSTAEVHNAYNLLWARTLYRHWTEEWRPNERPFNLTRSGYAGMQRYAPFLWSGDVGRTFTGLQEQPELLLNMGMSGLAYYSSDLGGFTGETTPPELYARWMQKGALTPMMRPHGVDNQPTEPWRFGQEVEDAARSMVRLRYRLMPYLYSLAWENHRTGMPLVRPLFFADPDNERLHEYTNAFLVGDALLVAPVLEEGAREKSVRLPEGRWINWHTDRAYPGGQTVTVDAPLGRLPMFVKAGATLPMRPVAPHTAAQPADTLRLQAYPDAGASHPFTLYEDDGTTLDYEDGAYAVTRLQTRVEARPDETADVTVEVGAASGAYDGQPAERTLQAVVHRIASAPARVTAGGEALARRDSPEAVAERGGWTYDADQNRVHVQLRGRTHDAHTIRLSGAALGGS